MKYSDLFNHPLHDERFLRDFFDMPKGEKITTTSSRLPVSADEVAAYCKKHLTLSLQEGRIIIGVTDDVLGGFIAIKRIPGSLVAEHVHDKRPIKWWHLRRKWFRRGLENKHG